MDKRKIALRVILSISLIFVLLITVSCSSNRFDYKNNSRMFERIEDLKFLDEFAKTENIQDKNAVGIAYEESRTCKIFYQNWEIYIYAYLFTTTENCLVYANKVSGNNYNRLYDNESISMYYYKHTSFFNIVQTEKLLVFDDEKAYVISAKISEKDFNIFIDYFMSQLPLSVEMSY